MNSPNRDLDTGGLSGKAAGSFLALAIAAGGGLVLAQRLGAEESDSKSSTPRTAILNEAQFASTATQALAQFDSACGELRKALGDELCACAQTSSAAETGRDVSECELKTRFQEGNLRVSTWENGLTDVRFGMMNPNGSITFNTNRSGSQDCEVGGENTYSAQRFSFPQAQVPHRICELIGNEARRVVQNNRGVQRLRRRHR